MADRVLAPIHIDINPGEGGMPREWEDFFDSIARITSGVGGGLTGGRLVETDGDNILSSVLDLTDYILETANEIVVTDNGNGTVTISVDDGYLPASVAGTADEITVTDDGDGSITISLPGSIKLDSATASRLLATDANKKTVSVADLTAWIAGTANEITVTSDGDGTITLSRPDDVTDENLTINQKLILCPSATTDITAAGGITATKPIMHIQGSGGAVDITANPQIAAGTSGQILILEGTSDTNTVQLDNGNGLHLHGDAILGDDDIIVLYQGTSEWEEITRNFKMFDVAWSFKSPAGASGTFYYGGFYDHAATDNDFNPAVTFGTANASHASHFYLVQAAGASGGTDTVIRVTGTTIDDQGNRTAAATVDITVDDAGAAGTYYETTEKWLGQVSIEKQSGPDLLCNYGFCKYWDHNNTNFKVRGVEATWLGGANDGSANIGLRHHKATGWTYNNGAAATPPPYIADMNTDHNTEINIVNGENGAWKRDNLFTSVEGSGSEGTIFEVVTSANKAFDLGNLLLRVREA